MRRRPFFSLLAVALLAWACAPETDLTGGGGDGAGAPGAMPATAGTLIDPLAGATGVPVNLAGVTVRFAAPVTLPATALDVCGQPATAVSDSAPCPGGVCYTATLSARLPENASC